MHFKVPLTEPKQMAWLLASYARDARARAEEHELPAFRNVKRALEDSLGIEFEGEKGEHFFRSTLVQTLFYGIFSAWVLWRHSPLALCTSYSVIKLPNESQSTRYRAWL